MAIRKTMCANHPDRPAIGVCVMTQQPICAECSTRYQGVNYSKEGLRLLQEQRAQETRRARKRRPLLRVALMLSFPLLVYLLYLAYLLGFGILVNISP